MGTDILAAVVGAGAALVGSLIGGAAAIGA